MNLKFNNITLSGGVAVGKGTLAKNLRPYLEPYGWKFRASGQIVRDYTKEYVKPNASLAPDDLHRKIDDKVHELLKNEKGWVIEAWLSGFLARDIPTTLRILLVCSSEAIKIDRVANRDKITVDEAKRFIREREVDNETTFQRLYGKHSFWDPRHYHVVIDTYSSGQLETTGKVLDLLGYDSKTILINKKS